MIKVFNGASSPVDGLMECDIHLGPFGQPKKVEFLVTAVSTITIIGCPTLAEIGIRMDCQETILQDQQGSIVRCYATHALKN